MSNNYVVYVHINKTNGKRYYGITSMKPKERWHNGKGYKTQYFARAINKYGWDGFDHIVIARNLTEDEAKWLEVEMIAMHNTTNPKFGYNRTSGGDGCSRPCSEGTKQKLREANLGKKLSEETKAKISKNNAKTMLGISTKDNPNSKPVICITTKRVFYSSKDAEAFYSTGHHIQECCRGRRKSCGKLPDGTKLVWRFINYKHNKTYRVA